MENQPQRTFASEPEIQILHLLLLEKIQHCTRTLAFWAGPCGELVPVVNFKVQSSHLCILRSDPRVKLKLKAE